MEIKQEIKLILFAIILLFSVNLLSEGHRRYLWAGLGGSIGFNSSDSENGVYGDIGGMDYSLGLRMQFDKLLGKNTDLVLDFDFQLNKTTASWYKGENISKTHSLLIGIQYDFLKSHYVYLKSGISFSFSDDYFDDFNLAKEEKINKIGFCYELGIGTYFIKNNKIRALLEGFVRFRPFWVVEPPMKILALRVVFEFLLNRN